MVLAWSVDGRKWESIEPNESFIPYFPGSGQWDCCSVFAAKQDVQQTPDYLAGHGTFPLDYAGCNGRFFEPRACGLGRVEVGRHQFAGLKNDEGQQNAMVEIAPTLVSTGQLLLTVGGPAAGARAGVVGDQALGACGKLQRRQSWRGGSCDVGWLGRLDEVQIWSSGSACGARAWGGPLRHPHVALSACLSLCEGSN